LTKIVDPIARRRLYPLRYHPEQARLWKSQSRFNVVPAGRRSGKTEIVGKRKVVHRALRGTKFPDARFFCGAPTRDQARRIYWKDLKLMVPKHMLLGEPSESRLVISLVNGSEIHVLGMDKPERIEGTPWDGGVLDEYGNMKRQTWGEHVRPALSDRRGWCDFIGVPEGRDHYYELNNMAKAVFLDTPPGITPEWNCFWWPSADILPPEEIEAARRDLDELTFQQEYEASFVNFTGRAYWAYLEATHCARLNYDPSKDLIFCFDFNVSPGVAVVVQEQVLPNNDNTWGSGIIGEVYIPNGSNTVMVCRRLIKDWGEHTGRIFLYGDSTGGAKGSAKILGSDWQLIKERMWQHFGNERVYFKVPKSNPRERDRVNSVNSRLLTIAGEKRMMLDPSKAPWTHKDFEGTVVVEGGSGEIDKKTDTTLSHLTDAVGYYVYREYPVKKKYKQTHEKHWK